MFCGLIPDLLLDLDLVGTPEDALADLKSGNRSGAVLSKNNDFITDIQQNLDSSSFLLNPNSVRDVVDAVVNEKIMFFQRDPRDIAYEVDEQQADSVVVLRWFVPHILQDLPPVKDWIREYYNHACFAFFENEQEEEEFVARLIAEGRQYDRFSHMIGSSSGFSLFRYDGDAACHVVSTPEQAWKAYRWAVRLQYGGGVIIVRNPSDPLSAVLPLAGVLAGFPCGLVVITYVDRHRNKLIGFCP